MRIIEDTKYDFSDLLIIPKRSSLVSRKAVKLEKEYTFLHSPYVYRGIPIVSSNMTHTGTFEMAYALNEFGLSAAIHKHYEPRDVANFFSMSHKAWNFYSMGILDKDFEKFKLVNELMTYGSINYVNIDVANGYSEQFVEVVAKMRDYRPDIVIMAGTVVTPEMTEALLFAGADIVRIGIGSGCLGADSRILMSNGTYKNIIDVKEGDEIITMHGTSAKVKRSFCTGTKKVSRVNHNKFYKDLLLTPDHQCFVGNIEHLSENTISNGYKKALETPNSTLEWMPIEKVSKSVGLLPSNIQWNIQETFDVDLSKYFIRKPYDEIYTKKLIPSYNLGYIFGFYLGDGNNNIQTNITPRGKSTSGRVEWNCFIDDTDHVEKLTSTIEHEFGKKPITHFNKKSVACVTLYSKQFAFVFEEFGKRTEKRLPEKYMCTNKEYLQGLYDGLMDSDGHYMEDGRHNFVNTSTHLIELFTIIHMLLFNSTPNLTNGRLGNSEKVTARNESFNCRTNLHPEWRILDEKFEIVKFGNITKEEIEIPVYDLEIDDPSHSFIANNMIVHNSVCTTRKKTGVGYPQASAVIECADAAHGLKGHVVSDGGCTMPGDVSKAFGAGTDFVMLGGMLAGHDEGGGEYIYEGSTPTHMKFHGMSSEAAMNKYAGGVAEYRASEGKEVLVPYRGKVENTIKEILGGIRSTCTYVGAKTLKELPKRCTFIKVNRTHNTIFGDEKQ